MAHPIHLHGHYFRVLGSSPNSTFPEDKTVAQMAQMGSSEYKINTRSDAPQRDSAHLPEAGWLAIRFASSNPGVWLLHCHINSHLSVSPGPRDVQSLADQILILICLLSLGATVRDGSRLH